MRKLIMLCAIFVFSAFVVSAQTTKEQPKAAGPQKVTVQQTSTDKAGAIKPATISKPVTSTQKSATATPATVPSTGPQKYGTHAPEFNDPNYHQKLSEWQRNYPDEVKAYEKSKQKK